MYRILTTFSVSVVFAATWLAPISRAGDLNTQDRKFLQQAATGGTMDLRLGQMGLDYGSSARVKMLAQMLVDDHTKANDELNDIANRKGVTLAAEDREVPNGLPGLTGAAFDKEFLRMTLKDHQREIKEFEKEVSSGSDPELKTWANKMLSILHTHFEAAKALARRG
jgi:putative membrane protein